MITNIVPVEDKESGQGVMLTQETFLTIQQFAELVNTWKEEAEKQKLQSSK